MIIKDYRYFSFSVLIAVVPFMINFENCIFGDYGTTINIICTSVFLVAWLIYGFKSGIEKRKNFILYTLGYFVINIVATVTYHFINVSLIGIIPAFVSLVPMFGFYKFISYAKLNQTLSECILILPIVLFSMIGYIAGLVFDKITYRKI